MTGRSILLIVGKFLTSTGISGPLTMMFKVEGFRDTGVEIALDAGSAWRGDRLANAPWSSDYIAAIGSYSVFDQERRFVSLSVSKILDGEIIYPGVNCGEYNDSEVLACAKMILEKIEESMRGAIIFMDIQSVRFFMPLFPERKKMLEAI